MSWTNLLKVKLGSYVWFQFYRKIKIIVNENQSIRCRLIHYLIDLQLLLASVRSLAAVYSLYSGDRRYFQYDILFQLINRNDQFDWIIYLCFILFFGYNQRANHYLFRRLATNTGPIQRSTLIDLVLVNTDDFIQSNQTLLRETLQNWKLFCKSPGQYLRLFGKLWNCSSTTRGMVRFNRPLKMFPNISNQNRTRIFLILIGCELLYTSGMICAGWYSNLDKNLGTKITDNDNFLNG